MERRWILAAVAIYLVVGLEWACCALKASAFSPDAWKEAKQQPNWSRKKLMDQFCKEYKNELDNHKFDRTKVLSLLGNPEASFEFPEVFRFKNGGITKPIRVISRISDAYQLSKGDDAFVFQYNEDGVIDRYHEDNHFLRNLVEVPHGKVSRNSTLEIARDTCELQTLADCTGFYGAPAKSEVEAVTVPPAIRPSSRYTWRLSADGRQRLIVFTNGDLTVDEKKRNITKVALCQLSADCPIKKSSK